MNSRPVEKDQLSEMIGFRVYPFEREITKGLADQYDVKLSDAARWVYRAGLARIMELPRQQQQGDA